MEFRRRLVPVLALTLGAAAAVPCAAVTATLVANVNADFSGQQSEGFRPSQLTVAGNRVVFAAFEPSSGTEIWGSDGTPTGTGLLRDTCPGPCGEVELLDAAGGVAFFLVGETFEQRELWRTDGTRAGTFPLDLQTGLGHSLPQAVVGGDGGAFFFALCRSVCEIWKSDGSLAGTVPVSEIGPSSLLPRELTAVGPLLFFVHAGDTDRGLWRSDGTAAGTALLHPAGTASPRLLAAVGPRLLFVAPDGADGPELWATDGTPAGTRPITGFAAPDPFQPATFIEVLGGVGYLLIDDVTGGTDLWRTDGTAAGTRRVTDFGVARPFAFGTGPAQIELAGGRLFFVATDGVAGLRLWQSGGTPASTSVVPGVPALRERTSVVRVGGAVLFSASDGSAQDLWRSDGTAAGTRRLRTVCRGSCGFEAIPLVPLPGQVVFATGGAVWRSNGTAPGTRRILSFEPEFATPFEAVAVGRRLYFSANDGGPYGAQLWVSDGTPAGTSLATTVVNTRPTSSPRLEAVLGGELLFTACDGLNSRLHRTAGVGAERLESTAAGCFESDAVPRDFAVAGGLAYYLRRIDLTRQLFRTDGTDAGTHQLTALPDDFSLLAGAPVAFGGRVLLPVLRQDGAQLSFWTSDGTPAGTAHLFDVPGATSHPQHLTVLGPELFFTAGTEADGEQVWRSDGTAAGTRRITALPFGSFHQHLPDFTRVGAAVYFVARIAGELELWRTDGTAAGTLQVPANPAGFAGAPLGLGELGGVLLYFGQTGAVDSARGLFRSDGTAAGTVLLAPVAPPLEPAPAQADFARLGDRLFFAAGDGTHGLELWSTDGTAAGTVLVADIAPGRRSSSPRLLTAAGGRLFFVAGDEVHGVELWQSDGTAAGTRLVQDLAPGALSSNPGQLTVAGSRLFFEADDGIWGREVWSLPLAAGPACQPAAAALCLNGGRFRAEAVWRDFSGRTGTGTAVPLSADTGSFWFFEQANVEVVLKVLDGRGLNGHFWTFYGALSNVEYTLTVTDTQTGAARRYVNPLGRFASVGDTVAFGPLGAAAAGLSVAPAAPSAPPLLARRISPANAAETAETVPCAPGPTRLCLNAGRFAVEAVWRDFTGRTGVGTAVALTGETGYFWFFDPANVEAVVKVLDGRPLNGKFWVFYGALSNVEYTLTVTDTQTGGRKTYSNPLGRFASGADTGAF